MRRLTLALAAVALSAAPAMRRHHLAARRRREPFEVFTIGDSYAAGEGAPDVDGTYDDNGDVDQQPVRGLGHALRRLAGDTRA